MGYDKRQAIKGNYRIAEKTFFTLALLLGSVGIYFAMQKPINHKKSKLKFKIGIPLLIGANIVTVFSIIKYYQ